MGSYSLNWNSFDWSLPDGDLIIVTIDHNVASPNIFIEFVLEAGPYVTWWKGIALPGGQEIWTQDAIKRSVALVPTSQIGSGSLLESGRPNFSAFTPVCIRSVH